MKGVACFTTLMLYAKEIGKARLIGDEAMIAEAKKR